MRMPHHERLINKWQPALRHFALKIQSYRSISILSIYLQTGFLRYLRYKVYKNGSCIMKTIFFVILLTCTDRKDIVLSVGHK